MANFDRNRDARVRFLLGPAGVRGVLVHLDATWRRIAPRPEYTPAVTEMLGEACAAAALFTGHVKVEGRLSIQLRGSGTLRTLFAECTAAGTLRGIARLSDPPGAPVSRDLRELGDDAVLAITIENPALHGREPVRYQGMVAIDSDAMSEALEGYFNQSEQLPTRLFLACDDQSAAGLMVQKLPGAEGDADDWNRVGALFDTVTSAELLDLPAEKLLFRLFHEEGVELLDNQPLCFACSCSRDRVQSVLLSLGRDEALAATEPHGEARVHCEFCGQAYTFPKEELEQLFRTNTATVEPPERTQ